MHEHIWSMRALHAQSDSDNIAYKLHCHVLLLAAERCTAEGRHFRGLAKSRASGACAP